MKKLLTTACLFVVTTIAIVSFIAPTVFGQEKKTASVNPSPAAGGDTLPAQPRSDPPAPNPSVLRSEFIFETGPIASAHASTIVVTKQGLVAAWFGGTREAAADVGIWLSRHVSGKWTSPVEVATGSQPNGTRYPCWNPVLFELPDQTLLLFYKVGPTPRSWWGMIRSSRDGGRTWGNARRLPDGILGPIKNKPLRLADGTLLSPSSTESPENGGTWRVHFERSADAALTWTTSRPPVSGDGTRINAIQPSILLHPRGRLQAIGRTQSGRVFETWSTDAGTTWSAIALTSLPNPNAGIDAVTLRNGLHVIVYNHTTQGRSPLNLSVSRDGKAWNAALVLESEPGEYSYPAVIQTSDGLVHVTYTWKRQRIKHVVIDPAKLAPIPMPDGKWPSELAPQGASGTGHANEAANGKIYVIYYRGRNTGREMLMATFTQDDVKRGK